MVLASSDGVRVTAGRQDFALHDAMAYWGSPHDCDPTIGAESIMLVERGLRLLRHRGRIDADNNIIPHDDRP
jgi:hypothetical protein